MSNRPPPVLDRPMPHRSRDFRLRGRPHYGLLAWLLLGLLGSPIRPLHAQSVSPATPSARATPPKIYLWGISEHDCAPNPKLAEQVERALLAGKGGDSWRVERLPLVSHSFPPACSGPEALAGNGCVQALEQWCPGVEGWLLGGRVASTETRIEKNASKPTTRTRLWLYDIKTKKSIVQDDYCQFCNQDTAGLVAAHARPLLARALKGRWDKDSGGDGWLLRGQPALPQYCAAPSRPAARPQIYVLWSEPPPIEPAGAPATPGGSSARPDGSSTKPDGAPTKPNGAPTKPPSGLNDAGSITTDLRNMKSELGTLLRELQHRNVSDEQYTSGNFSTAVGLKYKELHTAWLKTKTPWRMLLVTFGSTTSSSGEKRRTFTLTLYDSAAALPDPPSLPLSDPSKTYECRESCSAAITNKNNNSSLKEYLARCFAECAQVQELAYRPDAACLSFPTPSCSPLPVAPPPEDPALPASLRQSQKLSNWLLGVGWTAAALPLATSAVLLGLDRGGYTLPNTKEPERPIHGALQPAIGVTFGLGVTLAAVAGIGTSVAMQSRVAPPEKKPSEPRRWLECPANPSSVAPVSGSN